MPRFTAHSNPSLPKIGIDLGYSATAKSTGIAISSDSWVDTLSFGNCIETVASRLQSDGPHTLILEAVLSTYHTPDGNPAIRGPFEKGRGWYHGPGVTTFAAALRFLRELDRKLPPELQQIPLVEGFLSYKPVRTRHEDDARRMLDEFETAERFSPHPDSEPICQCIEGVPEILRYNPPHQK
ncbi:hypothetical protein [Sulfuriroseicoccus oceanibius]|uniref:Uncharacterized protein n=1 Tax=Sulfuriroseicoccus oceanibius TaxID=2707525 RepID=A0A6B3L6H2_9BACT|nr:hypothetical protein [Sulfuriroseicoccus oceanibius]QQL46313.1 hypothetical protein G3M56_007000 [Sulfuriroseicoccus oceanibius]